jgi:hypothetical protein
MFNMPRIQNRYPPHDRVNGSRKLSAAIKLLLVANIVCPSGLPQMAIAGPSNSDSKPDVRTLKFPSVHPVGSVDLMPGRAKRVTFNFHYAAAKDTVTVTVPPNTTLLFASNQYAALHPALFNEVSPAGIDAVKISFMSMDEKEDGICDKAMPYASHFTDAIRLDISESDASDAGVDSISAMPKLQCLWAYQSSIRGSCLKRIDRFPRLKEIDLSGCSPFHEDDLKYLAKLHDLTRLEFSNCFLSKKGVSHIVECKNLTFLNLSRNKDIDDSCLPLLLPLKNLKELWLKQTPVTAAGLMVLTGMSLKNMTLSKYHFSEKDRAMLHQRFPHVAFDFTDDKLKGDTRAIFSPILGH